MVEQEFLDVLTPVDGDVVPEDVQESLYFGEKLFEECYDVVVLHALIRYGEEQLPFLTHPRNDGYLAWPG